MTPTSGNRKLFAALIWIAAIFLCACFFSLRGKAPQEATPSAVCAPETREADAVRICFWNINNYLDTYRMRNGRRTKAPKPESEKAELVKTLAEINPDILGIAEIGGLSNLEELRLILERGGLPYPYFAISDANADYPQCAILSRLPLGFSENAGKKPFEYFGEKRSSPRGLTLASFKLGGGEALFGVLHLKSRFGSRKRDRDFSKFRKMECEAILECLQKYSECPVIICGDFNDEPCDKAPETFTKGGFKLAAPSDAAAPRHSYVWAKENRKYLYDFFLANSPAIKLVEKSAVLEINPKASDHAPVYVDIRRN